MKNKCGIRKNIFIAALIFWFCVIFAFSAQTGENSSVLSDDAASYITGAFAVNTDLAVKIVRKGAHLAEYAVAGFLLCGCFCSVPLYRKRIFLSFVFAAVFAVLDELHQYYVPGRNGCFKDVLIDCAGAAVGIAVFFAARHIVRQVKKQRGNK